MFLLSAAYYKNFNHVKKYYNIFLFNLLFFLMEIVFAVLKVNNLIMKKIILILFFLVAGISVQAENYGLYRPENYNYEKYGNTDEKILFIMDFSNSMTDYLNGQRKLDLMLETMAQILPHIGRDVSIGLRIYGHKMGFTAFEACRASTLAVPIAPANSFNVQRSLNETKPRGMTPITYSLKQAIKNDFIGFPGKKHIILLTDGGENCDESPCKFAMELIKVRKDVVIDVIAFNIDNEDDLAQLECTSLVTSGKFYTANTAAELANSLNSSLNARKEVDARIVPNY